MRTRSGPTWSGTGRFGAYGAGPGPGSVPQAPPAAPHGILQHHGVSFFFSFYDSEVAALRRQFRPAPVSCCLATDQQAGHAPSAVAMAAEPAW